ncbi:hypothetical protein RUND412_004047 [Rhizina undulata]
MSASSSARRSSSAPEIIVAMLDAGDDGVQEVQKRTGGRERKNLGMLLLMVVVILWVTSNFLFFAIFSDDSYSKPYFVIYLNTATFSLYLIPCAFKELRDRKQRTNFEYAPVAGEEQESATLHAGSDDVTRSKDVGTDKLTIKETMRLSAEFCLLWFIANYFGSYCFVYTSVASGTILGATSSVFTLFFGSMLRIERFTITKFVAVLVAITGIFLVSTGELDNSKTSAPAPPNPDLPPEKTTGQILLGDAMALLGAVAYGLYITLIKVRIKDESRVNMQMFFGFVGLFNVLALWPGIVILHHTGIETFELPHTPKVWWIVGVCAFLPSPVLFSFLKVGEIREFKEFKDDTYWHNFLGKQINAMITLTSDYCWAFATLLTTPIIVTVGLSLTIPLALLGQMLLLGRFSSMTYWTGAALVFLAFFLVNREGDAEISKESERIDSARRE